MEAPMPTTDAGEEIKAVEVQQPKTKREREVVPYQYDAADPLAVYFDTNLFEQAQRLATLMSRSSLVPEHFQARPDATPDEKARAAANCFLVVGQARRWNMDPFHLAQSTFVVKGKLGYEGKLVAARINTDRRLSGPLRYRYFGDPGTPKRGVVVYGILRADPTTVLEIDGTFAQWHTKGRDGAAVSDQWLRDPDQMLSYRGARQWARRYLPEAMLGILSDDEVKGEVIDVEPEAVTTTPAPEPPSPARRLEDLAERLRTSDDPPDVAAAKGRAEVTTIIEGQLRKSIELEKQKRDVREKAEKPQAALPLKDREPGEEG